MVTCIYCGKKLDSEHDSHYYCRKGHKPIRVCTACFNGHETCPECGSRLQHHEESITKKAFFNPATRSGLGF